MYAILYIHRTQFYTFNIYKFSKIIYNSIYSTYTIFKSIHDSITSMYIIFWRMYAILYIQSIQFFQRIYTIMYT